MKLNKGFAPVAIVFIIIAVIALGGVAYFAGKSSNSVPQNVVPDNYQSSGNQNNAVTPPVQNTEADCLPTTSPWIKVLSPNGGETYTVGQQITVKWTSCNIPASSYDIFVALHQNGEWKNVSYLSNGTINDGNEVFTIPEVTSGEYKIRIGSISPKINQA